MDVFTQSTTQTEILNLSKDKFRWKTEGKIDSVADVFDDDFVFVHINGVIQSKEDWIKELKSRRFIYNKIDVKQASVKTFGATVVLVGKATFTVTIHGHTASYNLVYTEVYVKENNKWKIVSLHTCENPAL
jgi:ketosteroid isomerase-like protein